MPRSAGVARISLLTVTNLVAPLHGLLTAVSQPPMVSFNSLTRVAQLLLLRRSQTLKIRSDVSPNHMPLTSRIILMLIMSEPLPRRFKHLTMPSKFAITCLALCRLQTKATLTPQSLASQRLTTRISCTTASPRFHQRFQAARQTPLMHAESVTSLFSITLFVTCIRSLRTANSSLLD